VLDHVGLGPSVDHGVLEAVVSAYSLSGLRVGLAPMLEDRDLLYDRVAAADRDLAADLPRPLGTTQAAADLLAAAFARWDGAGEGRIRVLAGPSSLMWASDRLLERCAELAGESGRPLHLHAAETWRQERIVRERFGESSIAALDRRGLLGPKTSLAHCIWVGDRDIELLADRGVVVVTNPVSNLRLGSGVAPVARLLAAGVTVAVGTDGAASNDSQNLPEALKLTALLAHRDGIRPAAGITRDALLAMGTTAGARAAGWDDGVGRIVAGAHADLALLDLDAPAFVVLHDALRQWLFAGGAHSARTVIVAGRVVLEDGEPTTIDVPAIAAELRERVSFDPEGAAVRRRAGRAALRQFIDSVGWTRPPRGA
jgi:5-methylthioadenosine/S-adenosylhomocysteine deaminase